MEKREKARQYWFVVQQLTARELKRKYARSVLGVVLECAEPPALHGGALLDFFPAVPPLH